MKNNEIRSYEEIKTLIKKEKQESLEQFLLKDFKSELSDRWEAQNKKISPSSRISWKPVLISGCLVMALALGSWIAYQKLRLPPFEKNVAQIEKIISQFPLDTKIKNRSVGTFEPPEYLIQEWRKIRAEKDIHLFFSQILKKLQGGMI